MNHKTAEFQAINKRTVVCIVNLNTNEEEEHILAKSYSRLQDFLDSLSYDYRFIEFHYQYD